MQLRVRGGLGVIVAQADDAISIERRVHEDPFVEHGVVSAAVLEVAPGKVDERLSFLMGQRAYFAARLEPRR